MSEEIRNKLKEIFREVSITKRLSLFVTIQREDSNLWDLVMGGENLDSQENLIEIIDIINRILDRNEIVIFSKLVLLNSTDSFVRNFNTAFRTTNGDLEIQNSKINNMGEQQKVLPKEIKQISNVIWELPKTYKKGMNVPARIYATKKLMQGMDAGVFEQITNVACLPGIQKYAYCMPDAHWGL